MVDPRIYECPDCGTFFEVDFEAVQFDPPRTVVYVCDSCELSITGKMVLDVCEKRRSPRYRPRRKRVD